MTLGVYPYCFLDKKGTLSSLENPMKLLYRKLSVLGVLSEWLQKTIYFCPINSINNRESLVFSIFHTDIKSLLHTPVSGLLTFFTDLIIIFYQPAGGIPDAVAGNGDAEKRVPACINGSNEPSILCGAWKSRSWSLSGNGWVYVIRLDNRI